MWEGYLLLSYAIGSLVLSVLYVLYVLCVLYCNLSCNSPPDVADVVVNISACVLVCLAVCKNKNKKNIETQPSAHRKPLQVISLQT